MNWWPCRYTGNTISWRCAIPEVSKLICPFWQSSSQYVAKGCFFVQRYHFWSFKAGCTVQCTLYCTVDSPIKTSANIAVNFICTQNSLVRCEQMSVVQMLSNIYGPPLSDCYSRRLWSAAVTILCIHYHYLWSRCCLWSSSPLSPSLQGRPQSPI